MVKIDNNELIPTRTITWYRVCMNYRKLNTITRKDHFSLLFIDQMFERLAGHAYYCFLDGYSGYNQIVIAPEDQEKTTFTCPYGTGECLLVYTMHQLHFKGACWLSFTTWLSK